MEIYNGENNKSMQFNNVDVTFHTDIQRVNYVPLTMML